MKKSVERLVKIGFTRNPRKIFDEIESISAEMFRKGWQLYGSCLEDGLGYAHLLFERDVEKDAVDEDGCALYFVPDGRN